jgi:assimilatory nitrate reductase catalytic subunit
VASEGQRRGSLFAPIHWSGTTSSSARIGALVHPATDPISGQPEMKATPASVAPVEFASRGFLLSRNPVSLPGGAWWAKVALARGCACLFAANETISFWHDFVSSSFAGLEVARYVDQPAGIYRAAVFDHAKLKACLFVGPASSGVLSWTAVNTIFEKIELSESERRVLLSGRAPGGAPASPTVCACFGVSLAAIREASVAGKAMNVEEIGKVLRAGTNCGSCLPELKKIVAANPVPAAL